MNEFLKLTQIPIVLYYGDYIADKTTSAVRPDKCAANIKWLSSLCLP